MKLGEASKAATVSPVQFYHILHKGPFHDMLEDLTLRDVTAELLYLPSYALTRFSLRLVYITVLQELV